MSPNGIMKVCEVCAKEYESNKFQPYITTCKKCRKSAKKEGRTVIKPTVKKVKEVIIEEDTTKEDELKKERLQNYMSRSKILDYLRIYKKMDMGLDTYILEAPDLAGKEWKQRISELRADGHNIKEKDGYLYLLESEKK